MGNRFIGVAAGILLFAAPAASFAQGRLILTPGLAVSNGSAGIGIQGKLFLVPNLGVEFDLAWTPQVCADCTLSQTTATTNLFYWINPIRRISLYLSAGPGVGYFRLTHPADASSFLPVFDAGLGIVAWPSSRLGIEIENRWFFPDGSLQGTTGGSLTTDRWFLGLTVPF